MFRFFSPSYLARKSATHAWLTVGLWVVLVGAALFSASSIKFDEEQVVLGSESLNAEERLEDMRGERPVTETVVVQSTGATVDEPRFRGYVAELVASIRNTEHVTAAGSYYETGDESLVSDDRRKLLIPVELEGERPDARENVEPLLALLEERRGDEFLPLTVGDGSMDREFLEAFEKDLQAAEMYGIPAAIIVLLFVFGAAVAAGVPIVIGLLGIVVAVGVTAVLTRFFGITSMVVNMITMIGLAVGIDYTLFIIERFREERAKGVEKIEAIVNAGNTASRAVLFSGITVIVALSGMFLVPATTMRGIAIGAIAVVLAAVVLSLTLLPAILSILGDKINWLHLPGRKTRSDHEDESGFWGRTSRAVMAHPLVAIGATATLLIAAAVPFTTLNLGSMGLRDFPDSMETVQAFRVLDDDFSAGRLSPVDIVIEGDVDSPEVAAALERLNAELAQDEAFSEPTAVQSNDDGSIGAMHVLVDGDTFGPEARDAVNRLRNDYVPAAFAGVDADVSVGGAAAGTEDYVSTMNTFLPIVVGFVLTLSFILLMLVFRSIVIPVKAIIMNLLSVGAAYGLIVLVFQHGVGAGLLGFQQSDSIEGYLPIFLFAILFGLSMDYHVFLLSRIQERFLQTRDNAGSVSYGLRSTAHIITGAAAIMMVVFGGFALGDVVAMQQTGFGLAVAVFIDATIVRSILVPATMQMLGDKNWYFPRWLEWLPNLTVEGHVGEQATKEAPAPAPAPVWEPIGAGGK